MKQAQPIVLLGLRALAREIGLPYHLFYDSWRSGDLLPDYFLEQQRRPLFDPSRLPGVVLAIKPKLSAEAFEKAQERVHRRRVDAHIAAVTAEQHSQQGVNRVMSRTVEVGVISYA